MKTKIGIPFGLALVMFIGVFTTMLALGALNPRPAEAAIIASGLMVERSNNTVNAYADWTITATNDGTAIPVDGTIAIDFTDQQLGDACDAGDDTTQVCVEGNWEITVLAESGNSESDVSIASVVITTPATATITVSAPIPASRMFTIKFFAIRNNSGVGVAGIQNPTSPGAHAITVETLAAGTINTFAESATIADAPAPMVTRSDNRVDAYAMWTITATTDGTNSIDISDTIAIMFTDQDVGADCSATEDSHAVCMEGNWAIGPDPDPAVNDDIATVASVSVDADTKTVRIVTATLSIAVDTEFTITFTPPPRRHVWHTEFGHRDDKRH